MIRRPPRSTQSRSSAASDVYKRQQLQGDDISVDRGRAGARDRLRPLSRHNRLARARKGPGKRDDKGQELCANGHGAVSYTHLRAHETRHDLVCRLLLEKKKKKKSKRAT